MRSVFLIMLLLFSGKTNPAAAQMKWVSPYKPADSIAAINLLQAGDAHFTASRYDSAFFYYDKMEQFSLAKKFYKGYMEAIYGKGGVCFNRQDYQQAEQYIMRAADEARRMHDPFLQAYGLGQLARIRMRTDRLDEAIAYFNNAIDTYFSKVPAEEGSEVYGELAFTYGLKGEYDKEIAFRIKSIEIIEKHFPQRDRFLGVKYSNLGAAYFNTNNKDKAIVYFKKAAEIREKYQEVAGLAATYGNLSKVYVELDTLEAARYLALCEKYALRSGEERWIVFYHNRAMDFYQFAGKPQLAMAHQLIVLDILEKSKKDPSELAIGYLHAAVLAQRNKMDKETVVQYFGKSEALAKQTVTHQKKNLREYYKELSKFYAEEGNYQEAYQHYRNYIVYKDSLTNDKVKKDFSEIAVRYETAKKDNEIARLNAEQRIKTLQLEKQEAVIAGNSAEADRKQKAIDLLARAQEVRDLKLKQQQEELERRRLQVSNNEQQLMLAQQQKLINEKQLQQQKQLRNFIVGAVLALMLMAGILFNRYQLKKKIEQQNSLLAVRNDIAKNLHDEIGSTLTSIKILSEVSKTSLQTDRQKAEQFMSKITEQSEAMQQGMSDIVWAITPNNDKLENMLVRMREYVSHTLEPKRVATIFNIRENLLARTIGMQQRKDFFLIFKEIINNAAKHSGASEVTISLSEQNGNIHMEIADNGRGFDTKKMTSSNGLKNISARAFTLGGTHTVWSEPAKGCVITVDVPAT